MASTTVTPSTFAVLTDSVEGRWPFRVEIRGTEYVLDTYGWGVRRRRARRVHDPPRLPRRRRRPPEGDRPRQHTARVLSYVGNWDPNREVFV
ncbi:hypothetical protein [Promicromonospora kroppenstedtii]|uniref:hypothetical protein n=1 Tax=Promicromonospora kroppenstedtii TaxID=440482 RepID=UPI0004B9DACA|nr:hypothetical protein [Promicromonospora kroppenstedtii]